MTRITRTVNGMSHSAGTFSPLSCVELSDRHRAVLATLADRHPCLRGWGDVVEELVLWGSVLESGELTGIGDRHAATRRRGMVG